MQHLYSNDDGEIVAADTPEQAAAHYDGLTGEPAIDATWTQIEDDKMVTIDFENGPSERKAARDWAAECEEPIQVATENY